MNETEQTKYKVVWSFLLCDSERKHITNEVSSYKMFFLITNVISTKIVLKVSTKAFSSF